MEKEQIKLALIASGSGTDARAIIQAHQAGWLPEISEITAVISTKPEVGNIEMAKEHGIPSLVIDQRASDFQQVLEKLLLLMEVKLVFLVGCIVQVNPVKGVRFFNIHPQHKENHGGKTMYGLKPHQHFLQTCLDLIERGRAKANDTFYVHPTVHDAHSEDGISIGYDCGNDLLVSAIPIPQQIIWKALDNPSDLKNAAKKLQEYILPFEWMMLPCAVRLAARAIMEA